MQIDYYDELERFIEQAESPSLTTKQYKKKIDEFQVKVSFGQGNPAKVPWISFLKEPNKVSEGIYPVYLYYKDKGKLILAYGISEDNQSQLRWPIKNLQSIKTFCSNNNIGKPERYGDSYIKEIYDIENLPDRHKLNKDLLEILNEYKKIDFDEKVNQSVITFDWKQFHKDSEKAGLTFDERLVIRFISSLMAKPFVILTGLSGSGKTKLAQSFVKWICKNDTQFEIIPVGADWTNREPLLGYPNALQANEYVKPENGALDLILKAIENPKLPYFLILDEMNLSHVERYFADFLSGLETRGSIPLHSNDDLSSLPKKIRLPENFFIIGTVNIDETTYMFSPKVLDRANTIEFMINKDEIINFFSKKQNNINLELLSGKGSKMSYGFLEFCEIDYEEAVNIDLKKRLVDFFEVLKKVGAEFGYRSAYEIIKLINNLSKIEPTISEDEKLDIAIMQKILPKLHGSRRKLCPTLKKIASFCVTDKIINVDSEVLNEEDFNFNDKSKVRLPLSLEKTYRMYKGALENGFTSYAEA